MNKNIMSTKFVSKNSNYMVVLRPGIEGNRALGTQAVPGIYIKFVAGSVDIKEESQLELMRSHPSCGIDFIEIKENEIDPYADSREESEPGHIIQEINFGHVGKSKGSPIKPKLTPAVKKLIEVEALKMIPGLLKQNPEILKNIILDLAEGMKEKDAKTEEKPASKGK